MNPASTPWLYTKGGAYPLPICYTCQVRTTKRYGSNYLPRYKRKLDCPEHVCFYCGELGSTDDHCPPLKAAGSLPRSEYTFIIVPACGECNGLLSALPLYTLEARLAHIAATLPKRYAKVLATPTWDTDELDELGESLRSAIQHAMLDKARVLDRIEYATRGAG